MTMLSFNPTTLIKCHPLTEHSQDIIFGSEGTAHADNERMEEINNEIGLTQFLRDGSGVNHGAGTGSDTGYGAEKEKVDKVEH